MNGSMIGNDDILHTQSHPRLMALFPGLPRWAGTRRVKPIWILLKQETVSGSGFSWAMCKSAPRSRQITTPTPHHSVCYRPDALPVAQPTASKHWKKAPYIHCTHNCRFVDGKVKWPALVVMFQLKERTAHSYFVEILQFCFGITRSKALHIAAQKC